MSGNSARRQVGIWESDCGVCPDSIRCASPTRYVGRADEAKHRPYPDHARRQPGAPRRARTPTPSAGPRAAVRPGGLHEAGPRGGGDVVRRQIRRGRRHRRRRRAGQVKLLRLRRWSASRASSASRRRPVRRATRAPGAASITAFPDYYAGPRRSRNGPAAAATTATRTASRPAPGR